jgi:hypothetical protein
VEAGTRRLLNHAKQLLTYAEFFFAAGPQSMPQFVYCTGGTVRRLAILLLIAGTVTAAIAQQDGGTSEVLQSIYIPPLHNRVLHCDRPYRMGAPTGGWGLLDPSESA